MSVLLRSGPTLSVSCGWTRGGNVSYKTPAARPQGVWGKERQDCVPCSKALLQPGNILGRISGCSCVVFPHPEGTLLCRESLPGNFPEGPDSWTPLHFLWKKARTIDAHSRLHKVRSSETLGSGRGRVLHSESSVHPLWGYRTSTGRCIFCGLPSGASGAKLWSRCQLVS